MVDLTVREETTSLLEVITRFGAEAIRPSAGEAEIQMQPQPGLAARLRQIGVVPGVSEEHGGQGELEPEDALLVAEALAHADAGVAYELLAASHAALVLRRVGDHAQRVAYLPRLADGAAASVLYYEGFGRGPSELEATATADGDDYILSGRKIAVVRPQDSDVAVVVARAAGGTAAFVLERHEVERLTVWRDDQATGKLGIKAARTGVVELGGVRVPGDRRLTGNPLDLARAIAHMRAQHAALALGAARASQEYARAYAAERVAFGKHIIEYQGVAFPLADVATGLEANRLNLLALVLDVETLEDPALIERRTTLAVNRTFKHCLDATRVGINSLGGHGYLMDHPVERWYRAVATLAAIDFDPLASDLDAI
ncbi:acyl-CoA dehydrogenase family protein [Nocardia vaccinii]|uniref:acyl-CoA dehydrogenase family protein n=1 Tax=Nocardia vaccinii TaxID=1822 RepID=UPI00082FE753|nr:acyl-CoA dehydrogenase family protein [Nocardia vaccinii]